MVYSWESYVTALFERCEMADHGIDHFAEVLAATFAKNCAYITVDVAYSVPM